MSRSHDSTNELLRIADTLTRSLRRLRFGPPVTHTYNPLVYARNSFEQYVERYGTGRRDVILLGMNPGPWGMVQTGVPFGEVNFVRDWLGIEVPIGKPHREHPRRPVEGFDCTRSEVSGRRIWGWARDTFHRPERFFGQFFLANYCPLAFLEESGRNRTPDKLPVHERTPLFAACDDALRGMVTCLEPEYVIGVGAFAAGQAGPALDGLSVTVGQILHPSPANPAANRGWAGQATAQLEAILCRSLPPGSRAHPLRR